MSDINATTETASIEEIFSKYGHSNTVPSGNTGVITFNPSALI